jgi:hypothetical protein
MGLSGIWGWAGVSPNLSGYRRFSESPKIGGLGG